MSKIIQIMPAPAGIFAEYINFEDQTKPNYLWAVHALGLNSYGEIICMSICDDGSVEDVAENTNFVGIVFK